MTVPRFPCLVCLAPLLAGCMASYGSSLPPETRLPAPPPSRPAGEEPAPSEQELRLGELLTGDPDQRRAALAHNPILARVAREKALDMARRRYVGHVDPDGVGTNTRVELAGYRLPELYDHARSGNNIESVGVGYATAEAAWRAWMRSERHRRHLLGTDPFFAGQTEYGIGYARVRGDPRGHYWVVLIARPAE